jgi:hypothetical protein
VIQILDEWNEGDPSYYVVLEGGEIRELLDIILTYAKGSLIPRKTLRTDMFRVIAYYDAKGNLEMARTPIGGAQLPLAGAASRLEGQTAE